MSASQQYQGHCQFGDRGRSGQVGVLAQDVEDVCGIAGSLADVVVDEIGEALGWRYAWNVD